VKTTISFAVLFVSISTTESGVGIGASTSSDAAIYDVPASNWKLTLVANDVVGGIEEIRQGHGPWKE